MKPNYCRLNVILAREAPKAVILRRGPTQWVQLILWNTDTDTFEEGQWFRGRVYERRCDLSPDGSYFLYFASKYHKLGALFRKDLTKDSDIGYVTWTAICKPPYFTALVLWPGFGTWGGGGYFETNNTIRLNDGIAEPSDGTLPKRFSVKEILEGYLVNQNKLYNLRLERNGWVVVQDNTPYIWQKDHHDYSIIMRSTGFNRKNGFELFAFKLRHISSGMETPIDSSVWADWDQQGRLVYIKEGRLFVGHIQNNSIVPNLIADFNSNKPKQLLAPESAKHW